MSTSSCWAGCMARAIYLMSWTWIFCELTLDFRENNLKRHLKYLTIHILKCISISMIWLYAWVFMGLNKYTLYILNNKYSFHHQTLKVLKAKQKKKICSSCLSEVLSSVWRFIWQQKRLYWYSCWCILCGRKSIFFSREISYYYGDGRCARKTFTAPSISLYP